MSDVHSRYAGKLRAEKSESHGRVFHHNPAPTLKKPSWFGTRVRGSSTDDLEILTGSYKRIFGVLAENVDQYIASYFNQFL